MKNNRFLILGIIVILSLSLAAPSAWAGNVQRNRWEGVAIGIGAALLGSALYNNHISKRTEREVVYLPPPQSRPRPHYRPRPSGYWEIRKEWIPPTYKEVWNPGHYNPKGRWIEGHWMDIEEEPGYWVEKRVWVTSRDYRHHD